MRIPFLIGLLIFTFSWSFSQTIEKNYFTTDKDIYAPKDTIWFKAYTFDTFNQLSDQSVAFHVIISDQLGNKISTSSWQITNGMTHGNLSLPDEEGSYFLSGFSGQMAGSDPNQIFKKQIMIRSGIADEIKLRVLSQTLTNDPIKEYSIGISAQTSKSRMAAGKKIDYEIWSQAEPIASGKIQTDENGLVELKLSKRKFPQEDAYLLLKIEDEVSKPIKLTVPFEALEQSKIDLQFFPEGGYIISGLSNKVAFKALDNKGNPFDFKGELLDNDMNVIDSMSSYYKGMGTLEIIPKSDQSYSFRITEPKGIDSIYSLPSISKSGILITLEDGDDSTIKPSVVIQASPDLFGEKASFQLLKNDHLLGQYHFELKHKQQMTIPLVDLPIGVYRMRAFDEKLRHQVERLFFAKPNERLSFNIQTDQKEYKAREQVNAKVIVKDSKGLPVKAIFSIAAVYKTRALAPDLQQPHLLAQILLQSELRGHVPTPNFYFSQDLKAKSALDLVILTNGWRRYKPSQSPNPESLKGKVVVKRKKKTPFSFAEINMTSIKTGGLESFAIDEKGEFEISALSLKNRGDSLLLIVNPKSKKESPNILFEDPYSTINSPFQKRLISSLPQGIDHKVYLAKYKIDPDKFQGKTILNTVEVVSGKNRFFRNGCDAMANNPTDWVTMTSNQLDLANTALLRLLKQVSPIVKGYGKISPENVRPRFRDYGIFHERFDWLERLVIAKDAMLSSYSEGVASIFFKSDRNPFYPTRITYDLPIPFEISINCDPIENFIFDPSTLEEDLNRRGSLFGDSFYKFIELSGIDFSNIESISVRESKTRPMLIINTKNQIVNRKLYLNRYIYVTTYKNLPAEFYNPTYQTQESIDIGIPDSRSLIFWKHSLMTDEKGEASFSFYNADRPQIIRISIEGIGANGQLGVSQLEYRMIDEKVTLNNQ